MPGLAGWLVIGRKERRTEVVGNRRDSQGAQRDRVQLAAVPTATGVTLLPRVGSTWK